MTGPIPIARFLVSAVLRRRRVVPHSHAVSVIRVLLGSMVVDASRLPVNLSGTVGLFEGLVIGGRLEIQVPPGLDVRSIVRRGVCGRVDMIGVDQEGVAHIQIRVTVALGRIVVRSIDPA